MNEISWFARQKQRLLLNSEQIAVASCPVQRENKDIFRNFVNQKPVWFDMAFAVAAENAF